MALRPLIKAAALPDLYLPNSPAYSPAEAARIKKFIPKFLTFVGVDSDVNSETLKQELEKQKLKLKGVNGRETATNNELRFASSDEIEIKIWNNVAVFLNIPFNNRQSPEDQKQQLDSKLQFCIDNQLYFVDKDGEEMPKNSPKLLPLSDINIHFRPAELKTENFDNSLRVLRLDLAVGVILRRKEGYTVKEVEEACRTDLVNSLKIMIRGKLPIRVLRHTATHQRLLILQSFAAKEEDAAGEARKLDDLLNKPLAHKQKEEQDRAVEPMEAGSAAPRKQLSNRQLMLILLGLFFIYLFLKINPLDRMLAAPL